MAVPQPEKQTPIPLKARLAGFAASLLIRTLCLTLRIRIDDRAGILENEPDHPLIWVFWHNRLIVMPVIYSRHLRNRRGAVLTSPSRDGAYISATMSCFGVASVRGSSSKRGATAMVEMTDWVQQGYDMVFTPDGPRGPRYRLAPGIIKLAQKSGAPIFALRADYDSAWIFQRSWDHFRLPKPFSKVTVTLEPFETIDPNADGESFEAERQRIEKILNPNDETD
jgi:lysophospholipid acyltransferase (LPLAT)-like uncharacterized protein